MAPLNLTNLKKKKAPIAPNVTSPATPPAALADDTASPVTTPAAVTSPSTGSTTNSPTGQTGGGLMSMLKKKKLTP